jgi:prolyl 4-hydroxylase
LLHWPLENGEGLQVLHYGPGAEYKPHYDYFDPAEPGTPPSCAGRPARGHPGDLPERARGRRRHHLPRSPAAHPPRKGNAVFFSYAQPQAHTLTLHGGDPVLRGEKWIATKWLREREFH